MDPVNYGFSETPVNVPLRDSGRYTPQPGQIQKSSQIPPISEEKPAEKTEETAQKETTPTVSGITPATPTRTFPFQQDVNNLDTARRNRLSERRYFPYAPRVPYALADAVYLDDTRQQQQIAGRARGAMEALGAFAGPSRQAAMASVISGQAGDQAANVAATMGNANAQIANQLEQFNTQMRMRGDTMNAQLAKNLFDETTTTLDTFDEKMRAYRTAENRLKNTLETNRAKAQLLNQLYPDFQINTMPGMYGDITANPEVLRAMQDPAKYKDSQINKRKEYLSSATEEAWTVYPERITQDGKDANAPFRAAYINKAMFGKDTPNVEQAINPFEEYVTGAYAPSFNFMYSD
jgi:hypothetical protein